MTTEKQAVKVIAEEIMKAVRKMTDENNRTYVDNQIKNHSASGGSGGSGSYTGDFSGTFTGIVNAINFNGNVAPNQVTGLYNTVSSYLINAPDAAEQGDAVAAMIMSMLGNVSQVTIQNATIDTAQIEHLFGSYGEFIHLVATQMEVQDVDAEQVRADIAELGLADIGSADIGFAQVKDLVSGTAIIREGLGGQLYIDRLSVSDANMVSLTTGQLVVKDSDGNFARIVVDSQGNVSGQKVYFDGDDVFNNNSLSGTKLIENSITARELNVSQIFADQALIGAITAANIDTASLFADSGFINYLTTSVIQSPTIGSQLDLSSNSSITLTNQKIDLVVSSQSTQSQLVLTDKMLNAISSRINFEADYIDLSANDSVNRKLKGKSTVFRQEEEPTVEDLCYGDLWVVPSTGQEFQYLESTGDCRPLFAYDDSGNLLYKYDDDVPSEERYALTVNSYGQLAIDGDAPDASNYEVVYDYWSGYGLWIELTNDQYAELIINKSGISSTVGELVTTTSGMLSRLSTVEQTASGLYSTVYDSISGLSAIRQTADSVSTAVNDPSTGLTATRQTANKISWIIASGTSSSNMTLTNDMMSIIANKISISTSGGVSTSKVEILNDHINISSGGSLNLSGSDINVNSSSSVNVNANAEFNINSGATNIQTNSFYLMIGTEDDRVFEFDKSTRKLTVDTVQANNMRQYIQGAKVFYSGDIGGLKGLAEKLKYNTYGSVVYYQDTDDYSNEPVVFDYNQTANVAIIAGPQSNTTVHRRVPPMRFSNSVGTFILERLNWLNNDQICVFANMCNVYVWCANCWIWKGGTGLYATVGGRISWNAWDYGTSVTGKCTSHFAHATNGGEIKINGYIGSGGVTADNCGWVVNNGTVVGGDPPPVSYTTVTRDMDLGWIGSGSFTNDIAYQGYTSGKRKCYACFKASLPSMTTVQSATMTVTRKSGVGKGGAVDVNAYGSSTTWGNRPELGTLYHSQSEAIEPGETYTFDVTSAIAAMNSGSITQIVLYVNEESVMSGKVYSANYAAFESATLTVTYN